jgi:hypothetical protein
MHDALAILSSLQFFNFSIEPSVQLLHVLSHAVGEYERQVGTFKFYEIRFHLRDFIILTS